MTRRAAWRAAVVVACGASTACGAPAPASGPSGAPANVVAPGAALVPAAPYAGLFAPGRVFRYQVALREPGNERAARLACTVVDVETHADALLSTVRCDDEGAGIGPDPISGQWIATADGVWVADPPQPWTGTPPPRDQMLLAAAPVAGSGELRAVGAAQPWGEFHLARVRDEWCRTVQLTDEPAPSMTCFGEGGITSAMWLADAGQAPGIVELELVR